MKALLPQLAQTGITFYFAAGGELKRASGTAHHSDSGATKLYDHRDYDVNPQGRLVQFS